MVPQRTRHGVSLGDFIRVPQVGSKPAPSLAPLPAHLWKGDEVKPLIASGTSRAMTHQRWLGSRGIWMPPDLRCVQAGEAGEA